ncbi:MAG: hypothetical protein MI739_01025 [Bacteroidales bacterium]|nr:hypothetical protein [Bacteroidales bacterium]
MTRNEENINLNELIIKLQSKDSKWKKLFKITFVSICIYILFPIGIFVFEDDLRFRIAGILATIAFGLFAYYFRKYSKAYDNINYHESLKKVLYDAKIRYSYFPKPARYITIPAIILVNISELLMIVYDWSNIKLILMVQISYIVLIGLSLFIAWIWWTRSYKPLWLSIKQLLDELDEQ